MSRLVSTKDLLPSERSFIMAMRHLEFGRFEFVQIRNGALVLDPWPLTVRSVTFGRAGRTTSMPLACEFELKRQMVEFFEYVRTVEACEIRCLEIRHGLPFAMEIQQRRDADD